MTKTSISSANANKVIKVNALRERYLVLVAVFLLAVVLRIYLLDVRWINPDEGAHLMDALLLMGGKVPVVDFESRQPIYVAANALILKLFGANLISGRLFPLSCSLLTGVFIFLLTKKIYDANAASIAAIVFWLMPLEVFNSVVVKTEALNNLLICASLYLFVLGIQNNKKIAYVLSGLLAALGYYVRQSALVVPFVAATYLAVGLFFAGTHKSDSYRYFWVSYLGVIATILLFYGIFLPFSELFDTRLNPVAFILDSVYKSLAKIGIVASTSGSSAALSDQTAFGNQWTLYMTYVKWAVYLHLFLLPVIVFSFIDNIRQFKKKGEFSENQKRICVWIPFLWLFGIVAAYLYFLFARGFYIDYFREIIPPMVVILSGWVAGFLSKSDDKSARLIAGLVLLSLISFVFQSYWFIFPKITQFAVICFVTLYWILTSTADQARIRIKLSIAAICWLVIVFLIRAYSADLLISNLALIIMLVTVFAAGWWLYRVNILRRIWTYPRIIALTIASGCLAVSISFAAFLLSKEYDSIWSREAVKRAAQVIQMHSAKNDAVISGGVIWEFEACRKPFLNISHPLVFIQSMPEEEKRRIANTLMVSPPRIIIKDGYTEKTYFKQLPWLEEFVKARYRLVATEGPAKYPIEIWRLE